MGTTLKEKKAAGGKKPSVSKFRAKSFLRGRRARRLGLKPGTPNPTMDLIERDLDWAKG